MTMANNLSNDRTNTIPELENRPYAPSWLDRLAGGIDGLPGSPWIYYLGIGTLLLLIQLGFLWVEGGYSISSFSIVPVYMSAAITSFLALTHYLDDRAASALATMRPAMSVSDEKYAELRYRLTTLPFGGTILASLIVVGIIYGLELIGGEYRLEELGALPVSASMVRVIYYLGFWVLGAFLYHTIHQLKMINETYTKHINVNLFRLKPLYAFSNLSALTAGCIAMITYGWLLVNPDQTLNAPAIILNVLIFLFTLVTFLWPQLGIHSLQVAEKDRLVGEANQRLEKIMLEIHKSVDSGKLGRMAELNMSITTLEIELRNLDKIRTWPWQPETVRWLITALVLPLGLWFAQFLLQRLLGP